MWRSRHPGCFGTGAREPLGAVGSRGGARAQRHGQPSHSQSQSAREAPHRHGRASSPMTVGLRTDSSTLISPRVRLPSAYRRKGSLADGVDACQTRRVAPAGPASRTICGVWPAASHSTPAACATAGPYSRGRPASLRARGPRDARRSSRIGALRSSPPTATTPFSRWPFSALGAARYSGALHRAVFRKARSRHGLSGELVIVTSDVRPPAR